MDINKNYMDVLNSIPGLIVVDRNENIVFMCEEMLITAGYECLDDVIGKNVRELLFYSRTKSVLNSNESSIGELYLVEGHIVASNDVPVFSDGKMIGALEYDFFQDSEEILAFISKIQTTKGLEHFKISGKSLKKTKYDVADIKGSSINVINLKKDIELAAKTTSNVMISGETGTGKELVAQSIHSLSQRSIFEFVEVNCAAIPGELFESELFGYEEGSFTGAKKGGKAGLVQVADKGTLFLDEIDSLPLHMQAKLLRFIQEREVLKIGGEQPYEVDVKIIAATNKNLKDLVESGEFREDLYYRLNVVEIQVAPLRNRKSDIPELVNNFILELNSSLGRSIDKHIVKCIDESALHMLMSYDWPGNIRELRNVIERAMNRCYEETLSAEHFRDTLPEGKDEMFFDSFTISCEDKLSDIRIKTEKYVITYLLEEKGMNVQDAAKSLGISRQMLHKKIKQYNIR